MEDHGRPGPRAAPDAPARRAGAEPEIWVLALEDDGRASEATLETAGFAARLAEAVSGNVTLVAAGEAAHALSRELAGATGMAAAGVLLPGCPACSSETWRWTLSRLTRLLPEPGFLLVPHCAAGWDLAPALAVDLDGSCVTGVTGFRVDGAPVFTRATFHGKLVEELEPERGRPAVITVMPGTERAGRPRPPEAGPVRLLELHPPRPGIRHTGTRRPPADATPLRDADVVVSAGRGVGTPEALDVVRRLADLFPRSALGASRPLCDMGWLPLQHQVGMTGQTISPRLYIACGISGAVQHTVGIRRADLIVSVNTDPQAPICRTAHCCVVEDLHTFLPVLIERIRAAHGEGPP